MAVNNFHFPFTLLAWDLQYLIVNTYLSPKDLYFLSLTSRMMNELAHLALYNKVRLLYGLQYSFLISSHLQRKCDSSALRKAQDTFIRQIISHPGLAKHVQELEWEQKGIADPSPSEVFLEFFPLLGNVGQLHLVGACAYDIRELSLEFPPIFPRVKGVSFSGCTGLNFAMAVLHSPTQLQSLTLDCISTNTCIEILIWMRRVQLTSLRRFKIRLGISQYIEPAYLFELLREVLEITSLTIQELHIGVVPSKGSTSNMGVVTSKFQEFLVPYFLQKPVSLEQLTIEGLVFREEDLDWYEQFNGQSNVIV